MKINIEIDAKLLLDKIYDIIDMNDSLIKIDNNDAIHCILHEHYRVLASEIFNYLVYIKYEKS